MTNLKHCNINTTFHCHHWLAISWAQSFGLVSCEVFMISSETGICVLMGDFECDSYKGKLKDVDFTVISVGL
jgi:hypothetical protein